MKTATKVIVSGMLVAVMAVPVFGWATSWAARSASVVDEQTQTSEELPFQGPQRTACEQFTADLEGTSLIEEVAAKYRLPLDVPVPADVVFSSLYCASRDTDEEAGTVLGILVISERSHSAWLLVAGNQVALTDIDWVAYVGDHFDSSEVEATDFGFRAGTVTANEIDSFWPALERYFGGSSKEVGAEALTGTGRSMHSFSSPENTDRDLAFRS
ncbi:MAG: hypothetical protein ACRDIB_04765 [Ardenticatenaceae bacterium]